MRVAVEPDGLIIDRDGYQKESSNKKNLQEDEQ